MPQESEPRGLLALMLYCESRRQARRTPSGEYVPLSEQDPRLWSQPMIDEAERELLQASTGQKLGRFQLEAAIQSVHARRAVTRQTDWATLVQLYAGLVQLSPTVGAMVGYAAAIAETQGPDHGLSQLKALTASAAENYQPYWALKAHLLKNLSQQSAAHQAYSRAIGLTEDPAIREFLLHQSFAQS